MLICAVSLNAQNTKTDSKVVKYGAYHKYTDTEVKNDNPYYLKSYNPDKNSSFYFRKASSNLIAGFALLFAGSALMGATAVIPDENPRKIVFIVGAGFGLVGLIELFVGSAQIGKASWCLDQERKVFMSPSKNGVGVEIKF